MTTRDDLLAAVYAEPDSDAPRTVLADLLLGEGDPRGEMIARQLAGDDAGAQPLVDMHGAGWLGSLRAITRHAQFRRGFPARLDLGWIPELGRLDLERIASDRALGTIEHLQNAGDPGVYAHLITSSMMSALRRIETVHPRVIEALDDSPARIVHVKHTVYDETMTPDGESFVALLQRCERRPEITRLGVDASLIDALIASPVLAQLTVLEMFGSPMAGSLEIFGTWHTFPPIWAQLPGDLTVTVVPPGAEPCTAGPDEYLGAIELSRDGGQLVGRAWGEWALRSMPHCFEYLPSELTRIELDAEPDAAVRHAAARLGLELEVVPPRPRHGFVRNPDFTPTPASRTMRLSPME